MQNSTVALAAEKSIANGGTHSYIQHSSLEDKTMIDIRDCLSLFTAWNTQTLLYRHD